MGKIVINNAVGKFLHRSWRSITAIGSFFLLFILVRVFSFSSEVSTDKKNKDYFNSHYKIYSLRIPKDLNFSGEQVPVNDFSVAECIDRELIINTYWHSQTLLLFKRLNRWFPVIEPILKRNGVPDDFKYVALVESGLTNSVSPAGATGYWQFLETTGTNYNLEIDEDVDERYNMERSTEAACKYFKEAYARLHNWTLVAASYNLGIGGVEAQLQKQKVSSYYDLYLNEETSRYVFRILAVKDIVTRPQAYGFALHRRDLYLQVPTIKLKIDSSINDLTEFAISQGLNYKIVKLMNPWLRKDYLKNPEGKSYQIELPQKGVDYTKWETYLAADSNAFIPNVPVLTDSLQQLQ